MIIHNFYKRLEDFFIGQLKLISTQNYLIQRYCGKVKSVNQSSYIFK